MAGYYNMIIPHLTLAKLLLMCYRAVFAPRLNKFIACQIASMMASEQELADVVAESTEYNTELKCWSKLFLQKNSGYKL